ncbi:MAG TPA: LemA family protein, partial [Vicinamibacteria bacterium]
MKKGLGCLAAVVVVVVILAVIAAGSYNRLVGLSQAVDAQWAQVESVYQRRADLIPNLVATVQGAA